MDMQRKSKREPMSVEIKVRISPSLAAEIQQVADWSQMTVSAFLREAAFREIVRREKLKAGRES